MRLCGEGDFWRGKIIINGAADQYFPFHITHWTSKSIFDEIGVIANIFSMFISFDHAGIKFIEITATLVMNNADVNQVFLLKWLT